MIRINGRRDRVQEQHLCDVIVEHGEWNELQDLIYRVGTGKYYSFRDTLTDDLHVLISSPRSHDDLQKKLGRRTYVRMIRTGSCIDEGLQLFEALNPRYDKLPRIIVE